MVRRGPGRQELEERREASLRADAERDAAKARLQTEEGALSALERDVVTIDAGVESARAALYKNLQSAATLQHAIERAEEGRKKYLERLLKEAYVQVAPGYPTSQAKN